MPLRPLILNVDDHEPGRYARSRLLRQAGFAVEEARTGEETLRLVRDRQPDLVVLDVHLPDLSGLEVCRLIKSDPELQQALVLQISASAVATVDQVRGLENGADAYLTEPVDAAVMLATVRALLRLRKAEIDLRAANLALKATNEELQAFAYVASHDLQEPLRTVSAYGQLLARRLGGKLEPETQEILGYVVDGANRMRRLIEDLLDYSHLTMAEKKAMGTVDLNRVFSWVELNLRAAAGETQGQITSDSLPTVKGDEAQLRQLFQNLLSNAIKYRRPDVAPQVHVSALPRQRDWLISVTDNGVGIAPEFRDQVFRPFRRLHGREIPGTGIGLAICRRIVENHGGRLWVEGEPGEGSRFQMTLQDGESTAAQIGR